MGYEAYNVDKVLVIVGLSPMREFASDSKVEIAYNSDAVEASIGSDGTGRFVESNDKSGVLTLHLQPDSKSFAELKILRAIGEPFPITVMDRSTEGTFFFAEQCMFQKHDGEFKRARAREDVEVPFVFLKGEGTIKGSKEI